MRPEARDKLAAGLLLALGLMQMLGAALNVDVLKGLGAASHASPHPKVFSAVQGLETYSSSFFLEWMDSDGAPQELQLTPEVYSRIQGPYNRRNVYGAAIAYAPVLASNARTAEMFEQIMHYALAGEAPLLRELGVDPTTIIYPMTVRIVPERPADLPASMPLHFEVPHE